MTSDVSKSGTEAAIPDGRYEQKRQEDLTRGPITRQTDERVSSDTKGHTVRINTGDTCTVRVVKVALNVNVQNQRDTMVHLNERLRRLRCR